MRGRGLTFFLAFTLAGSAILVALGSWQWQRRAEKRAFIARIAEAAAQVPRPLHEAKLWDRVTLTGRFVPGQTAYVRTSRPAPKPGERDQRGRIPVSGFGVMVISVLQTEFCEGTACWPAEVLINRGFLPTPPSGEIPSVATPEGSVTLTGFLRPSEREGLFPPYNDPAKGVFFFRSTEAIARSLNLAGWPVRQQGAHPALAFSASVDLQAAHDEAAPPFGINVPDLLKSIPDNHLEYAITWWSLAATNLAVAAFVLLSWRRRRDENAVTDGR
jgi:surfeit locus 1 family protein